MSNKNGKICRFCLESICENNFDTIEDITKQMLDVLLLNLNLEITEQPIICNECSKNLQLSFDFKLRCIDTNKTLLFDHSTENHDKEFTSVEDDNNLCQICMKNTEEDCLSALYEFQDEFTENIFMSDILQKHMQSELDLNIPEQLEICTSCLESLQVLLRFSSNCLDVEEKIRKYANVELAGYKGQIELFNVQRFTLKMLANDETKMKHTAETEIKEELTEEINGIHEEITLKDEIEDFSEIDELKCHFEGNDPEKAIGQDDNESFGDFARSSSSISKNAHKCNQCTFETKYRTSLERHMWLVHKSNAESKNYKCTVCLFETKFKYAISKHLLLHKNSSEVSLHKCTVCSFKSKFKSSFQRHMVTHKEITPYKCTECKYETKQRRYLRSHMLLHKDSSEVTMYKCSLCSYNTKFKNNLVKHVNIHRTPNVWFVCEICTYRTRYKGQIKNHMLKHKKLEEILYKCTLCTKMGQFCDLSSKELCHDGKVVCY